MKEGIYVKGIHHCFIFYSINNNKPGHSKNEDYFFEWKFQIIVYIVVPPNHDLNIFAPSSLEEKDKATFQTMNKNLQGLQIKGSELEVENLQESF